MSGGRKIPSRARKDPGYDCGVVDDGFVVYASAVVVVSGSGVASVQYSLVSVMPGDSLCSGDEVPDESGVVYDFGVSRVFVCAEVSV